MKHVRDFDEELRELTSARGWVFIVLGQASMFAFQYCAPPLVESGAVVSQARKVVPRVPTG